MNRLFMIEHNELLHKPNLIVSIWFWGRAMQTWKIKSAQIIEYKYAKFKSFSDSPLKIKGWTMRKGSEIETSFWDCWGLRAWALRPCSCIGPNPKCLLLVMFVGLEAIQAYKNIPPPPLSQRKGHWTWSKLSHNGRSHLRFCHFSHGSCAGWGRAPEAVRPSYQ